MKNTKQLLYKIISRNKILNYCFWRYVEIRKRRNPQNADLYNLSNRKYWKEIFKHKKERDIWFLLEQSHTNCGDVAIGLAESVFFEKNFPDFGFHYIYEDVYFYFRKTVDRQIKKDDIIVLRGGGNLGDEYIGHERRRREIIQRFKNNIIISMPQTFYFSNSKRGEIEKAKSIKAYSKCKKCLLCARDTISFNNMKTLFTDNKVVLMPDTVMTLDYQLPQLHRDGIVFCFRDDTERILTDSDKDSLLNTAKICTNNIRYVPMKTIFDHITFDIREKAVLEKINNFKASRLVITDRLHGMIFCAISGTPCIALSNYNHKVSATFEWLKHLDYIIYVDSVDEAIKHIPEFYEKNSTKYDNKNIVEKFNKIKDYINC